MASSSSSGQGEFWRTDWFAGVLIAVAALALYLATDWAGALERRLYDLVSTSSARQPSDRIAIIAIDDQSMASIGRWPWSRDIHARLIDQLATAKAQTIVEAVLLGEPQVDRGLDFIRRIKTVLASAAEMAGTPPSAQAPLAQVIAEAETALDGDRQLAASLKNAGNVILPSVFALGNPNGKPGAPLPAYTIRNTIQDPSGFSLAASKVQHPLEVFATAAAGVGHLNAAQDADGAVRHEALLVNFAGRAAPSVALLAALQSHNLTTEDIKLNVGESVQIGKLRIKTDRAARMLPHFYKRQDGKPVFATDSFVDVLNGKIPASRYANKIVIIGATTSAGGAQFAVPGIPALSQTEAIAHATSSILKGHVIDRPAWGQWGTLGAFLLVCAYLIGAVPRLSAGLAALLTALFFIALLGAEFGLLSGAALWLEMVFPATVLLGGHLALTAKRFALTQTDKGKPQPDDDTAETNRMMGLALQGQGQLDLAFDRFRRVPVTDALMDNLYKLALDFERKPQPSKAQAVFEHMAAYNLDYKDLRTRLNRSKKLAEPVMGASGGQPGPAIPLDGDAAQQPMLGRYLVEKELGKGAMGVVYLGKDPKIGRVVAVKTLALSAEFEGEELVEARERFFREAETAGRLQHQNIVTIFDAGEAHDLAYIAMEFLKGKDLADYCKPGQLLAVPVVLGIVARVAEALAYAHRQHVVHRDIKPANIMFDIESDTVKVTDFGIARITDSSKTKTGLVLGTPSFMSPEQLAGKKVDGRSDLYSLGVMLFQMLAGVLPFRGNSMGELMYKIASEEAPDIRSIRPDLAPGLARLVAVSLNKSPENRYQDGDQLARDLRAVLSGPSVLDGKPAAPVSTQAEPKQADGHALDLEI